MAGKYNKKTDPRELLWDARRVTSAAIRNDRTINTIFSNADRSGLSGDSRFVVLSAALINERKKLIEDRNIYAEAVRTLTQKQAGSVWSGIVNKIKGVFHVGTTDSAATV